MPATSRVSQPRACESVISRSATWSTGGSVNGVVGVTLPSSTRGGDGEGLERRSRLVGGPGRAVRHRVVGRLVEPVGVDPRPVGEREDRAVARVHHQRRRALRLPQLADLGEHLLGVVLDVGVEREPHVLARHGAPVLAQLDRLAERVADEPALAVAAADAVFEAVLQPGEPGAVGADRAEQLRRHPVARVLAAVLRDELEPLDVQLLRAQRPPASARGGRGRRTRCRAARACAAARPRERRRMPESCAATSAGLSIR